MLAFCTGSVSIALVALQNLGPLAMSDIKAVASCISRSGHHSGAVGLSLDPCELCLEALLVAFTALTLDFVAVPVCLCSRVAKLPQ